ncbi:MAG: glycosyltransferase [Planctomycetota bacterium]|nr:glycosyltransferase [Planctomycetota bacterium]
MNAIRPPLNRILFLATELRPGGAEKCLVNLACGIDRGRFQPLVVSLRSSPALHESRLCKQLDQHGVPTYFLECDSKLQFWKGVKRLRNIIREQNVSIVQSFLYHANVVAGIALRHENQVRFFSGIRVAEPNWIRHKIEKLATRHAERMICVSERVKQHAFATMRFPKEKLTAIPNSVETPQVNSKFNLEDYGITSPFVVFVGRLEKQKGLLPFMSFIKKQTETLPDFEIVFVGEGSERSALQRIANQLDRKVHFTGWVDQPQDFIARAELVFLPSLWEGMPNTLLETMALGKPFLAFGVDGIGELNQGSTRIDPRQIITPGNYSLFLQHMAQLINEHPLSAQIGQQNQKQADSHFSTQKMIAAYEGIYLGNSISLD